MRSILQRSIRQISICLREETPARPQPKRLKCNSKKSVYFAFFKSHTRARSGSVTTDGATASKKILMPPGGVSPARRARRTARISRRTPAASVAKARRNVQAARPAGRISRAAALCWPLVHLNWLAGMETPPGKSRASIRTPQNPP